MRAKKYIVYDDLRKVGTFQTLKQVFDTGLIKGNKTYFYKMYAENQYYFNDNIFVYDYRDKEARCVFLGTMICRRAKLCPNISELDKKLTDVLKQIIGRELDFLE